MSGTFKKFQLYNDLRGGGGELLGVHRLAKG